METTFSDETKSHEGSNQLSLFVGCLDPSTTKDDIVHYFRQFDPSVKAKLIVNFKTGLSKQCALLFCSSPYYCDLILQKEHHLHQRRLRVDRAQEEYKGKKTEQFIAIQVSGLDPAITIDEVNAFFANYEGFSRARLIQGLHPKQKKVAVVYFNDSVKAEQLLKCTHVQIGNRNCKIAEYSKDKSPELNPKQFSYAGNYQVSGRPFQFPSYGINQFQYNPSMVHPGHYKPNFSLSGDSDSSKSLGKSGQSKVLQPLKLEVFKSIPKEQDKFNQQDRKGSEESYVHPVEIEDDDLYRIFCGTKDKINNRDETNSKSAGFGFRKIVESKETAPEEE